MVVHGLIQTFLFRTTETITWMEVGVGVIYLRHIARNELNAMDKDNDNWTLTGWVIIIVCNH